MVNSVWHLFPGFYNRFWLTMLQTLLSDRAVLLVVAAQYSAGILNGSQSQSSMCLLGNLPTLVLGFVLETNDRGSGWHYSGNTVVVGIYYFRKCCSVIYFKSSPVSVVQEGGNLTIWK